MVIGITILILVFITSKITMKLTVDMLLRSNCIRKNFRGKEVVYCGGIAFLPILISTTMLCMYFFKYEYVVYSFYILGISAVGFAGVLDDTIGEKSIKGILNHFKSFLHGHLTTGFLKAFIGGITSVIVSFSISSGTLDFCVNTINIALFTNTLNLMDLRPGRSAKVFLFVGLFIFAANIRSYIAFLPLGIALVMAAAYLPYDLKELCMQGDTGSNILGITLGYYSSINSSLSVKLLLLLTLLTLNLLSEKVSLTMLISKNKFLSFLDGIGRSSL